MTLFELRLKTALERKTNITRAIIARACNMTWTQIHRAEEGTYIPRATDVQALAAFYGISTDEMIAIIRETTERREPLPEGETPPEIEAIDAQSIPKRHV